MLLITLIKVIVLMSVASIMAIKKKHSFEIGGFFFFFFCKIKTKMIVGEKQGLTILTLKYSQILKTLI